MTMRNAQEVDREIQLKILDLLAEVRDLLTPKDGDPEDGPHRCCGTCAENIRGQCVTHCPNLSRQRCTRRAGPPHYRYVLETPLPQLLQLEDTQIQPPAIDPGEGYRILRKGDDPEPLVPGDDFKNAFGMWRPARNAVNGDRQQEPDLTYRRRVTEPKREPSDWDVIGEWVGADNPTRGTRQGAAGGENVTELGCANGNCYFRHNTGQVTNAGCTCVRAQEVYTQALKERKEG